jgi:phosphoglycerol transferase MdoB-like AlkP superfamily enzyme
MDNAFSFLGTNIRKIVKDKFLLISILGTLVQYILFIMLLSDGNAVSINLKTAFIAVPPILVYLSFACIPYAFCFLFKGLLQRILIIIVNILISTLLIFDLWYYRSNSAFLNYYMFDMVDNLEGLSSSILAMFRLVDLIFLSTSIILIIILIKNIKLYNGIKNDYRKFALLLILPLLYLAYNQIKVDKFQRGYGNQYLFRRTWSQNQMMFNLTPLGFHVFDYYTYRQDKKPYILSQEEENKIKGFFQTKEKMLPKNSYSGIFKGKNLIAIQVESLENFVINEKINNQEITPNLNKLLNNSLYFSNFHEQTYNGTTSDATFVSNTSLYPTLVGTNNFNHPYNSYNSLPKLFNKEGYTTHTIHGEKGTYWNWATAESQMGFEECLDISSFNADEMLGLGISDKSLLTQTISKLNTFKKPFYTFMITLTSHSPFTIPQSEITIDIPDSLNNTKTGGFLESIRYTDAAIGNFIAELDKNNMLEDTVIAIYGDHEGLNKFFSQELSGLNSVPEDWKSNSRRVPLIIYSKGLIGKEFTVTGGQVDFLPTISSLFGIDEKEYVDTAMGRNLLNTNKDFVVLTNRTYKGTKLSEEEKKKYIDILQISNSLIKTNYFKGRY